MSPQARKAIAVPAQSPLMPEADARQFLAALARANPNPQTELHYRDPFTLLVAVVLSAQTTDAAVNRVTQDLFAVAPTPEAMVRLGVEGVARYTQPLGFWQTKARNVVALSQQLIDRFNGKVPDTREALEALPGVGRKSANVVLNVAFGQSTMPVDTHVFRVANRTGLAHGESPFEVEEGLIRRVPPEMLREAHHLLILHGRYVCKARRPECWRCAGAPWCRYPAKTPAASGKAEEGRPASRRSR